MLFVEAQASPYLIRRETYHIYTRPARHRVQLGQVRSERCQRIPVPLPNRTSIYQVCSQEKQ